MIVYGANPVMEAIRAHPDRVRFIGITREQRDRTQKLIAAAQPASAPSRVLSPREMGKLAGRCVASRVLAVVTDTEDAGYHDTVMNEQPKFVLILDGITDPQSFGAILRVADGFGVDL